MKKHYLCLLYCMALLGSSRLFAQGLVSVNNFTGTASVAVPMYTVTQGSISVPVAAVYNAGGLKVKDVEGNAGMGWNVIAGGGIYRTVRGLPDDIKKDSLNNDKKGWLYNSDISNIAGFTVHNTSLPPVCTDETTDITNINSDFNSLYDTEPDIYNVSAPGLSCQLVFDASHNVQVIPYRDYKVTFITNPTTGNITSFTIINDQGTQYSFANQEREKKLYSAGTLSYYKKEYAQYHNGIVYTSAWKLTSIGDVNGDGYIYFSYIPRVFYRNTPVNLALGGTSAVTTQYTVKESFFDLALSSISTGVSINPATPVLSFYYANLPRVGNILTHIDGFGSTKTFQYVPVNTTDGGYVRQFLQSMAMGDQTLYFTYSGVSLDDTPTTSLPDSTSKKIDYWGYYKGGINTSLIPQVYVNPSDTTLERYRNMGPGTHAGTFAYSIAGADRSVDTGLIKVGTMDTIKYSHGGYTKLIYEPNSYYDPTAGANVQGGGLRIKEVRNYNGTDTATVSLQGYSYLVPGTAKSSGKPVSLPMFEFTTPYSGSGADSTKWRYSTVRSEDDLSPEDNTVIYSAVKVSQPLLGRQLYEYSTPATFWDRSYSTDWQPTTVYIARTNCGVSTFATTGKYTYSFPVNANYGFERGLLTKTTNYNSADDEVSESAYTYQRTGTPTTITGFKFGSNLTDTVYAKYNIYANAGELTTEITNKVYNLNSTSLYQTNTVDNYYASAYHKLLTQQKTTNSDGTINRVNYKYAKDYITTGSLDSASAGIYYFQQANANIPIESYAQVERGGTNRTVGAGLVEFNTYHTTGFYPQHKLRFISGEGVTDFAVSAITSGFFTADSRYITVENDLMYDSGNVLTADDNNHHVSTVYTNAALGVVQATASNAAANEIAYGIEGADVIEKNPFASYYIFSAKISASIGGTFTVTLTSGAHTHTYSFSLAASNTPLYYQLKLPLTDMGSLFSVAYSASVSYYMIDAIAYPNISQVSTYDYDPTTRQKTVETNTNGKSVYYDYGLFNRPSHVYDNEHNMVQTTSYVPRNGSDVDGMGAGSITYTSAQAFPGYGIYLSGGFSKMTNPLSAVYHWQFGDGDEAESAASMGTIQHIYATADSFTVHLTVTSPYYPSKTYVQKIYSNPDGTGTGTMVPITVDSLANGSGAITNLNFFDLTGKLRYSFTTSQLAWSPTVYVERGTYNVSITVVGQPYDAGTELGFNSVQMYFNDLGIVNGCATYVGKGRPYQFSLDLTGVSSVLFIPTTDSCTP